MKANEILYPFDESVAKRIARVVGPSGAFALALAELDRRRASGEDVYLFCASSTLVVGPMPDEKHTEQPEVASAEI